MHINGHGLGKDQRTQVPVAKRRQLEEFWPRVTLSAPKKDLERTTSPKCILDLRKILMYAGYEGDFTLIAVKWMKGANGLNNRLTFGAPHADFVVINYQNGSKDKRIEYRVCARRSDGDGYTFYNKLVAAQKEIDDEEEREEERRELEESSQTNVVKDVRPNKPAEEGRVLPSLAAPPLTSVQEKPPTASPVIGKQSPLQAVVKRQFDNMYELMEDTAALGECMAKLFTESHNGISRRDEVLDHLVAFGLRNRISAFWALRRLKEMHYLIPDGMIAGEEAYRVCKTPGEKGSNAPRPIAPIVQKMSAPEVTPTTSPLRGEDEKFLDQIRRYRDQAKSQAQKKQELEEIQREMEELRVQNAKIAARFNELKARKSALENTLTQTAEIDSVLAELRRML